MLTVKVTVPQAGHVGKNAEILIPRHAATPDRILADHCWVDIADVQHLLDEATAPAVARVFAAAGGHPLTAHLTAADTIHTPGAALA
jgi:hypothetical protein